MLDITGSPFLAYSAADNTDEREVSFASPFGVSLLKCQHERHPTTNEAFYATKTWTPQSDGTYIIGGYNAGMWFYVREVPAWTLAEQNRILTHYSQFPTYFVVRGALTAEIRARLKLDPDGTIIRLLVDKAKHPQVAFTRDVMRQYFWDDIDKFQMRAADDLVRDPDAAVHYAVQETLPACFHDVSYFWQLSASCGSVPGQLSVHIAFDTSEPMHDKELKARIKALKQSTPGSPDLSVCSPAQKFWIASPVMLNGAVDPLPRRRGAFKGSRATVAIPPVPAKPRRPIASRDDPPEQPAREWQQGAGNGSPGIDGALARLGDGEGLDGFHWPLGSACYRYAMACRGGGAGRDDTAFIARLQAAVTAAPKSPAKDRNRYLTAAYLQGEIDSAFGALDRRAAEQTILMALAIPPRPGTSERDGGDDHHRLKAPKQITTGHIVSFFTAVANKRSTKAKR